MAKAAFEAHGLTWLVKIPLLNHSQFQIARNGVNVYLTSVYEFELAVVKRMK